MKRILFCIIALAFALSATRATSSDARSSGHSFNREAQSKEALAWADSVMRTLTERQRVAQLFIPHLVIKDDAAGRALLSRMVKTEGVGGILLGKGTISSYVSLIGKARSEAKVPLLVTLDGEWGPAMRLTDAARFPHNMALGAITDRQLLHNYGAEVARQCRALGINVDFAPVADVNSNPDNPVIGYRSFGQDAGRVADAVEAYSRGMEQNGVLSVAKHFPGHGDTSSDSHKTLPTVGHSAERLDETDLVPFQRYINAGLSGIMVGHLKVPALDPSGTPASLSEPITTIQLRKRMGFDGLVFTDALAMKGAMSAHQNNCVSALLAGADFLLGSASPSKDIDAVLAAVKHKVVSRELINERCRKVLAYKYALGLNRPQPALSLADAREIINGPQAKAVREQLAAGAITAIHDNASLLPVKQSAANSVAVVSFGAPAQNLFTKRCAELADVDIVQPSANLKKYKTVIAAFFNNSAESRAAFTKLSLHPGLVGVFFMNPYKMARFTGALHDIPALVLAGDDTPELRTAAAEGIFGREKMSGRLPVELPSIASLGAGKTIKPTESSAEVRSLAGKVDSIMAEAIEAKAFPGGQVVVMKGGKIMFDGNYGYTDYRNKIRVNDSTIYDLASVTKASATLAGLMRAYDEGLFKLDDPVSRYVPGLDTPDKRNITFRQMLFHESGLPSGITVERIFRTGPKANRQIRSELIAGRESEEFDMPMADGLYVGTAALDTLMQRIYDVKLKNRGSYRYSDLNFVLLREALENMTGVTLDQWVDTEIFMPAGISNLTFNPLDRYPRKQIAPTETDNTFRRQTIHGHVHDETAAVSGGVQGNAGLFGSATALAQLAQMFLDKGNTPAGRVLKESTVKTFTTTQSRSGRRFLGFDRQPDDSPAPRATFGHNGFTGTCFWVDPVNDIVIVFLSNRVHPSRDNRAFTRLKPRTAVIEAVYSTLVAR